MYFSISSREMLFRNFPSELHRLQYFHHSLSSVFYIVKRENLPFSTQNVPLPDKIYSPVSNTRPSKTGKAEFYELLNVPPNFFAAACEIRLRHISSSAKLKSIQSGQCLTGITLVSQITFNQAGLFVFRCSKQLRMLCNN